MAKVQIELDLDVVEQAIELKVASAVEEFLGRQYDIKKMIVDSLMQPEKPQYASVFQLPWGEALDETPLIERIIVRAITSSAKKYTAAVMRKHSEIMDEHFRAALIDKIGKLKFDIDVSTELSDDDERDSQ